MGFGVSGLRWGSVRVWGAGLRVLGSGLERRGFKARVVIGHPFEGDTGNTSVGCKV